MFPPTTSPSLMGCLFTLVMFLPLAGASATTPTLTSLPKEILLEISTFLDWPTYFLFGHTCLILRSLYQTSTTPDRHLYNCLVPACVRLTALLDRYLTKNKIMPLRPTHPFRGTPLHPLHLLVDTVRVFRYLETHLFQKSATMWGVVTPNRTRMSKVCKAYWDFMERRVMKWSDSYDGLADSVEWVEESEEGMWEFLRDRSLDDKFRQLEVQLGQRQARTKLRKWLYAGVEFEIFGQVDFAERVKRLEAILNQYPDGVTSLGPTLLASYIHPSPPLLKASPHSAYSQSLTLRMQPLLHMENEDHEVWNDGALRVCRHRKKYNDGILSDEWPFPDVPTVLRRCKALEKKYGNIDQKDLYLELTSPELVTFSLQECLHILWTKTLNIRTTLDILHLIGLALSLFKFRLVILLMLIGTLSGIVWFVNQALIAYSLTMAAVGSVFVLHRLGEGTKRYLRIREGKVREFRREWDALEGWVDGNKTD
ncbi:hypothetical protein HDV00_000625 [Rhizophlyctis rosea]|nr:hypothetical protein HDV00_000625 [Rhizophlyctis rosea]